MLPSRTMSARIGARGTFSMHHIAPLDCSRLRVAAIMSGCFIASSGCAAMEKRLQGGDAHMKSNAVRSMAGASASAHTNLQG